MRKKKEETKEELEKKRMCTFFHEAKFHRKRNKISVRELKKNRKNRQKDYQKSEPRTEKTRKRGSKKKRETKFKNIYMFKTHRTKGIEHQNQLTKENNHAVPRGKHSKTAIRKESKLERIRAKLK